MSMVIVGSKAFDLANVVLLELREPHGDDRHPHVVATFANRKTIEVTPPTWEEEGLAQCVMEALLRVRSYDRTVTLLTVHDVSWVEPEEGYVHGAIHLKDGRVFKLEYAAPGNKKSLEDVWKVDPSRAGGPAVAVIGPKSGSMRSVEALVTL